MKQAILVTALAGALVCLALLLRNRQQLPETPSAAVNDLIDAAEKADAKRYVNLTGGDLRKRIEQSRSELGSSGFREHMERFARGIKGVAILNEVELDGDTTELDVELTFVDRNERQQIMLERRGKGWVITSMETVEMVKPLIKYGTPVFEEADPAEEQGDEGER